MRPNWWWRRRCGGGGHSMKVGNRGCKDNNFPFLKAQDCYLLSLCFHIFSNLYFGPTPSFFFLLHKSPNLYFAWNPWIFCLFPLIFMWFQICTSAQPHLFSSFFISPNLYFILNPWFFCLYLFIWFQICTLAQPHLSLIRGCVRPSVGRSVMPLLRLVKNEQKWSESYKIPPRAPPE